MNHLRTYLVLMLLFPLSNCVFANANNTTDNGGDGTKDPIIVGSVSDAYSKKPVKGVTISVTSIKDRIAKSFTTDASGKFSIPTNFSSGEVTIVLEKKGYKTYKREKIILKEGVQLKLDVDLNNADESDENNVFHPLLRMMDN